jgi:hypothetical protein
VHFLASALNGRQLTFRLGSDLDTWVNLTDTDLWSKDLFKFKILIQIQKFYK